MTDDLTWVREIMEACVRESETWPDYGERVAGLDSMSRYATKIAERVIVDAP